MDKALRNVIIAGVLFVTLSITYYFVYFMPSKQRRLENARQECAKQSQELWMKNQDTLKQQGSGEALIKASDFVFNKCMREKGVSN